MQSWEVNRIPGRSIEKIQDHLSLVPLSETQTSAFSKLASRRLLLYRSRMEQRVSIMVLKCMRIMILRRGPQLAFNLGWFHCTLRRPGTPGYCTCKKILVICEASVQLHIAFCRTLGMHMIKQIYFKPTII
jgi:hypothetical protein